MSQLRRAISVLVVAAAVFLVSGGLYAAYWWTRLDRRHALALLVECFVMMVVYSVAVCGVNLISRSVKVEGLGAWLDLLKGFAMVLLVYVGMELLTS